MTPGSANKAALAIATLALLAGLTSSAGAYSDRVQKACAADYRRLCPAYDPLSPSLRACMEKKGREISAKCVDALIAAGETTRAEVEAGRRGRR